MGPGFQRIPQDSFNEAQIPVDSITGKPDSFNEHNETERALQEPTLMWRTFANLQLLKANSYRLPQRSADHTCPALRAGPVGVYHSLAKIRLRDENAL